MIEQKLIVGRYLELNNPAPSFAGPPVLGFQEVNQIVMHIAESESSAAPSASNVNMPGFNPTFKQQVAIGFQRASEEIKNQVDRQRTSTTGLGAVAKVHRNFVWLEWLGGLVSEVKVGGIDILTGPFTGCWLVSYLRGGVHYIGHVGTCDDHADPRSIAAKAAWNTFAASVPSHSFSGFNPFNDDWVGVVPVQQAGEGNRKYFGLVTVAGDFYTIIAYPQVNKTNRIRIAGIQKNKSSLPANGQI
jgi:hypothetical protein